MPAVITDEVVKWRAVIVVGGSSRRSNRRAEPILPMPVLAPARVVSSRLQVEQEGQKKTPALSNGRDRLRGSALRSLEGIEER